jgi:hypothetical protein
MKLILTLAIISASAVAAPPAAKPDRWSELMRLVGQEMKIVESAKHKGPELKYRMLELHSERLKLLHEKNNKEFMAKAASGGSRDKESYFAETRAYYAQTKNYGLGLLKEKTPFRPHILFAMALNSRDYGRDNVTEKLLLETISLVNDPHHSLRHHAETALADFYYNEKRFNDAITYYQRAIRKVEDEWLPKHLFNLSWCYLKVRDFDRAISTIKDAYFKTREKRYVNIKDQLLDNVGSFYVYASRPLEGLSFYLENEKDPVPYLMPMGLKAMNKGHEKETETILAAVQKLIDKNGWEKYQEELFHTYLDFYRHYSRFQDHEKVARKLVAYYQRAEHPKNKELKLPVALKDDAIEKMRSLAGFLQVKVAKDMKQDESQYRESDLRLVLDFFDHLITLDPTRKVEYFYFRAETYYSVRRFKNAAPSYEEAVLEAKATKNDAHARKALNSLLALTGMEVLEKGENKKYLTFAYVQHLDFWPRDEKSEVIYPKLFEIYREDHQDEKATELLRVFHQHYPEHLKHQQELMTKVLDQFIEKKDTVKLAHSVHRMKGGFLSFSKDTIEKTEIVLGNILFLQYQEMAKAGQKVAAAQGFEEIYANKLYTNKVKYQSAFFAGMTYLEMGETQTSFKWLELARPLMTKDEALERRPEELKITERMYRLQDFVTANRMAQLHLKHHCKLKDKLQDRFYEIAVMTALVEEKAKEAEAIANAYAKCTKSDLREQSLAQVYQFIEKRGDFYGLRLFVQRNLREPFVTQYRYSLQKWHWERSNLTLKEKIREEFRALKHEETLGWLKEIDQWTSFQQERALIEATVIWNRPAFDGDAYNKSLEAFLLKVTDFKQRHQNLTRSTQLDLAIMSTRAFGDFFLQVGKKIQEVRPAGMDEETLKHFTAAMKQVSGQFLSASGQYQQNLSKALKDKETMTKGSRTIASVEDVENPVFSFFTGLTMDKPRD